MDTGTVTLILVVAIVVSLFKPFLELRLRPDHPLHDTTVRLLSIVVGLVAAIIDYMVHTAAWQNGAALEVVLGRGLAAGVGAVLTYHLLTSSVWDVLTPGSSSTAFAGTNSTADLKTATDAFLAAAKAKSVTPALVPAKVEKAEIVTPVADPMPAPPPLPDSPATP